MSPPLTIVVIGDDEVARQRTLQSFAPSVGVSAVSCSTAAVGESLASVDSEFAAVVRAGDVMASRALYLVTDALRAHRDTDILYGDHDLVDADGRRSSPFHKPAWSPERLWGQDYPGSMTTYRTSLLRAVFAASRLGEETCLDSLLHGMVLAVAREAEVVLHLPRILCHRCDVARADVDAHRAVVQHHFDAIGFSARAVVGESGSIGFEPELGDEPLVSIVIPTGGSLRTVRGRRIVLVDNAIRSLVERSTHQNIEIVVVVDSKSTAEMAERLARLDDRVVIVKDDRPFNFAAACNLGVERSTGSTIILLNDDTEIVTHNWIERLVALSELEGVGAVGVKLLYADGRLQHGGVASRSTGPDHLYHGYPGSERGHGDWLESTVNCFAATGACLAMRRDVWSQVGGMDEAFPLNYNDIDLCLRLQAENFRTVVDNRTVLVHLETSSREAGSEIWEVEAFRERWQLWMERDPYDNPNLVSFGLQQIPPPPALTELAETRGSIRFGARRWTRDRGFGIEPSAESVNEAVGPTE